MNIFYTILYVYVVISENERWCRWRQNTVLLQYCS